MGKPITRDELNVRLCEAFGIDTEQNAGFRLTVLGGEWPALEVFQMQPTDEQGRVVDDQAEAVESLRFIVLPADSPEALRAEVRRADADGAAVVAT